MKLFIKIVILSSIVWPKIFFGQTYFNMLYPPEPGTWGSGSRAIVVTDTMYYMNRWFADVNYNQLGHHLTKIGVDGIDFEVTDTLFDPMKWIANAGVITDSQNLFVDIISVQNYSPNTQQYGVVKYDSSGNIEFINMDTNLYPYIWIQEVIGLPDGSIVSVGNIDEIGGSWTMQKACLIKSDSLGNEIWKKTYSIGGNAEIGSSIALCPDGGFIIGGSELIINGPDRFYSPIVIKTDSNGTKQWHKKYGSTEYSNWPAYGITPTQDGGYAFCGGVGAFDTLNMTMEMPWIVKLDSFGNMVWADTNIDNTIVSNENRYEDIIELDNGSLVACGKQLIGYPRTATPVEYKLEGIIKKVDKNGHKKWTRFYSHPEIVGIGPIHELNDLDPTPDGGFVMAGWAAFNQDNLQCTWVVKVDSFGCLEPGCEVISVPKIEGTIAALKLYPNPVNDILNVEITPSANQREFVFELYDILGKRVLAQRLQPFQNTVNVGGLSPGVYSYRIGEVWGHIVVE